jgi:hypothetical protein
MPHATESLAGRAVRATLFPMSWENGPAALPPVSLTPSLPEKFPEEGPIDGPEESNEELMFRGFFPPLETLPRPSGVKVGGRGISPPNLNGIFGKFPPQNPFRTSGALWWLWLSEAAL